MSFLKDPERMRMWKDTESEARRRPPRHYREVANKYISSFVGFAPADDPEILGMCVIYDPQGIYYGGTIAAPVIGNIFEIYCLILALKNNWKCSILGKVRD
mgnify:CR=1 FL=1